MLSKVAERIYWTARYLERVESTARLISIYDQLLFDLPRRVKLSWYNLIIINGTESNYQERYSILDERNVVKFMIGDQSNPCSIVSSLTAIRENVRTTRDVIPEEVWELINELSLYVNEHMQQGINRSQRHQFLEDVIKGCQQILGLVYGSMPHDNAWDFMRLGRNVERADMTSRNLDAGIAAILQVEDDDYAVNSRQIIWGNVLRSLNAGQSYRRTTRVSVQASEVVRYLIENKEFPKSITHCINALINSGERLPSSDILIKKLKKIHKKANNGMNYDVLGEPLREYLNELQIDIGDIHSAIAQIWFLKD